MIKAIIFDCWDTLFYINKEKNPFDEFAKKVGRDFSDYEFLKRFEEHFMLKKYPKLNIPIKQLLSDLKIKHSVVLINELKTILDQATHSQKPFPETFNMLRELKKGRYKIGLISNTFYQSFKKLKRNFKLDRFFDVFLESYNVGIMKPNPQIFDMIIKKLKINKDEALMVGDTLKDDIQAAEKCGIKGILIDRENKHPDYPNRITSLEQIKRFL